MTAVVPDVLDALDWDHTLGCDWPDCSRPVTHRAIHSCGCQIFICAEHAAHKQEQMDKVDQLADSLPANAVITHTCNHCGAVLGQGRVSLFIRIEPL